MTPRARIIVGLVCLGLLLAGVAIGRFSRPAKVTEKAAQTDTSALEAKILTLESKLRVAESEAHRTETTVIEPSGKTTITKTEDTKAKTTTAETVKVDSKVEAVTSTVKKTEKVTEARPSWKLTPMAGLSAPTGAFVFGGMVEHRLAGPVSVGGWALAGGGTFAAGISASVEF